MHIGNVGHSTLTSSKHDGACAQAGITSNLASKAGGTLKVALLEIVRTSPAIWMSKDYSHARQLDKNSDGHKSYRLEEVNKSLRLKERNHES